MGQLFFTCTQIHTQSGTTVINKLGKTLGKQKAEKTLEHSISMPQKLQYSVNFVSKEKRGGDS